jgi:hypothetical protein
MIGDTIVTGEAGDITGIVDMIVCANCVKESARLVGCATPAEVDDLVRQKIADSERIENLEKELQSWQERFNQVIGFTKADFDTIAEKISGTPTPSPPAPVTK